MKIPFGAIQERRAYIYEIESEELRVGISDFGAAVQFVKVRQGNSWTDVCPGFDYAESYAESGTYLGATVGRVANRISGAAFTLGVKRYNLSQNDGANCHHGGGMLPGTDTGPASHGMCAGVYPLQARKSDKKIRGGNTPLAANFSAYVSLKFC